MLRITETRFLSASHQKDFRYFLKTQVGSLSSDYNIEKMVKLCFSKSNVPGLQGAFWRFENIKVADDPKLKTAIARRIKESDRTLGAIARILLEEITRFSGCERPCVKFPVDVGHIPELMTWFPDCKVMHITRDPRAMAMSKSNDPYGTALRILEHPRLAWLIRKVMVWFAIANYRWTARIHSRLRHVDNYRLFRYEDLLAEPDKTIKELCQFIDVEFTEDLLHPEKGRHEHQRSSLTGEQKKAFDAAAAVRWQEVIPAMDKWLITTLTRRSMKKLGYDPDTHPIFRLHQQSSPALCEEAA